MFTVKELGQAINQQYGDTNKVLSSGMWRRVVLLNVTDVSEERTAYMFTVKELGQAINQQDGDTNKVLSSGVWRRVVP
jgi:hypothetical protein